MKPSHVGKLCGYPRTRVFSNRSRCYAEHFWYDCFAPQRPCGEEAFSAIGFATYISASKMLASHYQQEVVRLKQKLAALSQKVARESKKRARISPIVQGQRDITHITSLPKLSAHHRRATWPQQKLAKTLKTLADLDEQVARKTNELYRAERRLASERQREQEAIERRHQHRELDHQRLITRELERQTKERQCQASTLVAFPVPAHAGWQDVSIRFTSDFQIQAKIRGQPTEARTYAGLGFEDRRGKTGKPDVQWRLLEHFVRNGVVVESHRGTDFKSRNALQKGVQKLRQRLKEVFGLDDDPIEYDVVENCYRAKFQVTTSTSTDVAAESQRRTEF